MESNIKGLVAAGHEMASELKAECGAVDMRSVAKLISDLATQLEVQLVRANALAEDQQKAIESIKQADAAVKLAHEKFSALAAENAGLKSGAMDEIKVINRGGQAYCVKDGMQVNPMYARGWNDYRAKSLQSDTPATDAFLAEVRAQGVEMFEQWCRGERDFTLIDEDVADAAAYEECVKRAEYFAAQLRKGGNQ
ncbi:hypothetical protein [Escherichia coli]|uniref:hypothetical protein n=1 Tax=Escherichia coli TaxID=562 RepID=UPI00226F6F5E|nr:hypothetical protein [Escherichia coli]